MLVIKLVVDYTEHNNQLQYKIMYKTKYNIVKQK